MWRTVFLTFCSLVLVSLFLSCKKDEARSNPDYYVKLLKDGSWTTWSVAEGETGPDGLDPSRVNLIVGGASDNGSDQFYIYLQKDGPAFGTGVFDSDDQSTVSNDVSFITGMTSGSPKYHGFGSNATGDSRYIVTITSVTDDAIEGSFTGNFLITMDQSSTVNITQGEFKVKRID